MKNHTLARFMIKDKEKFKTIDCNIFKSEKFLKCFVFHNFWFIILGYNQVFSNAFWLVVVVNWSIGPCFRFLSCTTYLYRCSLQSQLISLHIWTRDKPASHKCFISRPFICYQQWKYCGQELSKAAMLQTETDIANENHEATAGQ